MNFPLCLIIKFVVYIQSSARGPIRANVGHELSKPPADKECGKSDHGRRAQSGRGENQRGKRKRDGK